MWKDRKQKINDLKLKIYFILIWEMHTIAIINEELFLSLKCLKPSIESYIYAMSQQNAKLIISSNTKRF